MSCPPTVLDKRPTGMGCKTLLQNSDSFLRPSIDPSNEMTFKEQSNGDLLVAEQRPAVPRVVIVEKLSTAQIFSHNGKDNEVPVPAFSANGSGSKSNNEPGSNELRLHAAWQQSEEKHTTSQTSSEALATPLLLPHRPAQVTFNLSLIDESEEKGEDADQQVESQTTPRTSQTWTELSRLNLPFIDQPKQRNRLCNRISQSRRHKLKDRGRFGMDQSRRSSSHPEQLHVIVDEGGSEDLFADSASLSCQLNGAVRYSSLPHSLLQSNDDTSMESLLKRSSVSGAGISHDSLDNISILHSTKDAEENVSQQHRPSEFRLRDQVLSFFQASDNKLAMKLFGSRNALLREKQRQIAARSWIIHPCSNFRLYWDLLMLIFLVTNLVVLPVSIAFFYDDTGAHWMVFNMTCDTMFILDIVINFRTGIIDNESHGNVILDSKIIARKYLKSWFLVDFISSLPLDYVFLGIEGQSYSAGRALRILRLAKLLQLLRLLRISRLVRYVRLWQEFFSLASIVVKLFNLICIMVLMGHWSGCIQFFVPVIQGLPEDSWIVIDQIQHSHWWEQYTRALFKALSHMLCIGYGQYPPKNMTDTWLTIGSMLAGATCYALFIGHATTLIQSFDTSSRQFRDHLQQVNEYMIYRKLPTDLRRRITDYYDHRFGGKMFDEAAILSEISDSLRKDVIYHNCRELIKSVPFFVNTDNSFVMDVITKLEFEMFQTGDIIIKAATKGDRMFFIQEGLIEIITPEGKVVTRLGDGSYFGEISLLTQGERVATVRAAAYSNLFSLSKEHFDRILENYPLMRRTLETIAAKRLHTLGIDPSLVTSRESLLDDVKGIQKVFETQASDNNSSDDDSDRLHSPTLSKESNSQFLTVVKGFFTKDSEEFSPTMRGAASRGLIAGNLDSGIQRCKSTLNHLVLVPQVAQGFTRRVKSTADVQNYSNHVNNGFHHDKSVSDLAPLVGSNASTSMSNSVLYNRRMSKRIKRSRSPSPDRYSHKTHDTQKRQFRSQPTSPAVSPLLSSKQLKNHARVNASYIAQTPEVRVIPHSDSSLNLSDNTTVKFTLDDSMSN